MNNLAKRFERNNKRLKELQETFDLAQSILDQTRNKKGINFKLCRFMARKVIYVTMKLRLAYVKENFDILNKNVIL